MYRIWVVEISHVNGKVTRKEFSTREQAEEYASGAMLDLAHREKISIFWRL